MSYLNHNIKYLRKQKSLTQTEIAEKIGIKRSLIGAYEEHRAEPKIETIQKVAYLFNLSLDALINQDLSKGLDADGPDAIGRTLRVLPIVVDRQNKEMISIVPVSARAGYMHSYSDPEYIQELPKFNLPLTELYPDKSYRIFQIEGDSMLPVTPGSYVICEYTENWEEMKLGQGYMLITKSNGILFKRVWEDEKKDYLLLKSDNPQHEPFDINKKELVEVWKSLGLITFDMPEEQKPKEKKTDDLVSVINQLQEDVKKLKDRVEN
ncbi:MAG: helix-turn-helix domain-containing protein [Saprospiraceae bacterium]